MNVFFYFYFYICEQVLFLCVNGNPAPVIRFTQFHYCTVSNPGTGADELLF